MDGIRQALLEMLQEAPAVRPAEALGTSGHTQDRPPVFLDQVPCSFPEDLPVKEWMLAYQPGRIIHSLIGINAIRINTLFDSRQDVIEGAHAPGADEVLKEHLKER